MRTMYNRNIIINDEKVIVLRSRSMLKARIWEVRFIKNDMTRDNDILSNKF